jgi:hypothetical protein
LAFSVFETELRDQRTAGMKVIYLPWTNDVLNLAMNLKIFTSKSQRDST